MLLCESDVPTQKEAKDFRDIDMGSVLLHALEMQSLEGSMRIHSEHTASYWDLLFEFLLAIFLFY